MSVKFRQTLLNDFLKKPRAKAEKIVKDFFDNGNIRIEKKDWFNVFSDAVKAADEVNPGLPTSTVMSQADWNSISEFVIQHFISDSIMLVGKHVKRPGGLMLHYRRNNSTKRAKGHGIIDLELHAKTMLRKIMTNYFSQGQFKDLVEKVLNSKGGSGGDQEFEHGKRQEPSFSTPPPVGPRRYDGGGTGSVKRLGKTLPGGSSGGTPVDGAQGTVVDKKMIAAIKKHCIVHFNKGKWYSIVSETIYLKWEELFGYNTSVKGKDTPDKVIDEVQLRGLLLPRAFSKLMKTNKGIFDRAILAELVRFLSSNQYFAEEIMRLTGTSATQAQKLSTGSPTTKDRMEKAAIKLAAAGVLDEISKKYIRKRKPTIAKTKTSSKGTTHKFKNGSSKQKRTAARTSRKSGRSITATPQTSAVALKELINQVLPEVMLLKMQPPALRNRTGRFRQSAEVTNVNIGPRGGTQIDYTYMRDPYETFEPGGNMGSRNRDPRKIIGESVREIAMKLTQNKFITTRRR